MKARLEIPSRAFILTIAFYETHIICEQIDGIVGMKPFQMILVFLRHLKYHLEDVSGFAIFPLHHPPPLRLSTRAK